MRCTLPLLSVALAAAAAAVAGCARDAAPCHAPGCAAVADAPDCAASLVALAGAALGAEVTCRSRASGEDGALRAAALTRAATLAMEQHFSHLVAGAERARPGLSAAPCLDDDAELRRNGREQFAGTLGNATFGPCGTERANRGRLLRATFRFLTPAQAATTAGALEARQVLGLPPVPPPAPAVPAATPPPPAAPEPPPAPDAAVAADGG